MNRREFVLGLAAVSWALASTTQAKSGRIEKLVDLTGTGKGQARYRIDPGNTRSIRVEVQNLKSLAGQTLSVNAVIGGSAQFVAPMVISSLGTGKIEMQSKRGQPVPDIHTGDQIVVTNGATTILSGTF